MPTNTDDADIQMLLSAAYEGDAARVDALLAEGRDVDASGQGGFTPLLVAIEGRRWALARSLLERGADARAVLDGGFSALHILLKHAKGRPRDYAVTIGAETRVDPAAIRAAVGEHPDDEYGEMLRLAAELLDRGVDLEAEKSPSRQRALRDAAERSPEIALMLIAAGAAIDAVDAEGMTPLHMAARQGSVPVIQALISAGAAASPPDHDGFTPLHEAAEQGHAEAVEQLLAGGADPEARLTRAYGRHQSGDRPREVAERCGAAAIVSRLRRASER